MTETEKPTNRGRNAIPGIQGFQHTKKTDDLVLDKIRAKKAYQYQIRASQKDMKFNPNASMRAQINSFASDFLPHKPSQTEEDFDNYYLPSENVFSSSGSGTDMSWGFSEFRYLAEKRIGLGKRVTRDPADDAVRNKFKFLNIKTNKVDEKTGILDWLEEPEIDFFNQLAEAIYFERVYGCGFLIKYYTENDRKLEDLSESPYENGKARKPVAFRAFSPLQMWPTNYQEFPKDPQKWKVRGGDRFSQEIHEDRVQVFISRPVEYRWWGLSIFEPIWYPIICYFMAQIFTLRAFSRLGNSIVYVKIAEEMTIDALYNKYEELLQSQKMNGMIITDAGSEVGVLETKIAAGLRDLMQIWIEDVSSGTGIPVVIMLGRSESAGIGSEMYLVFERYYWNMIAKIQASFSDDVLNILKSAGFKLDGYRLDWALAIVKTDAQRLADEGMVLQNEALEKQNKLLDMQMQAEELELAIREEQFVNGDTREEGEGGGNGEEKKDFLDESRQRRIEIVEILRKRRLAEV